MSYIFFGKKCGSYQKYGYYKNVNIRDFLISAFIDHYAAADKASTYSNT